MFTWWIFQEKNGLYFILIHLVLFRFEFSVFPIIPIVAVQINRFC